MGGGVCVRRGGGVCVCERRGCEWEEGWREEGRRGVCVRGGDVNGRRGVREEGCVCERRGCEWEEGCVCERRGCEWEEGCA